MPFAFDSEHLRELADIQLALAELMSACHEEQHNLVWDGLRKLETRVAEMKDRHYDSFYRATPKN